MVKNMTLRPAEAMEMPILQPVDASELTAVEGGILGWAIAAVGAGIAYGVAKLLE